MNATPSLLPVATAGQGVYIFTCSSAPAGEAPPRAHQREPEPAQGAHPAAPGQGGECRGARIPAGRAGAEGGGALWHRARRLGGQRCSCQGPTRGLQAAPKAEPRLGGADRPNAGHCAGGTQLLARAGCSWQPAGGLSVLIVGGVQSSHYSKLEKADILEMTVRFLQELPASSCPTAAPSESPRPRPRPAVRPVPRTLPGASRPLSARSVLRQLPRRLPSLSGTPGPRATCLPCPGACSERPPVGAPAPEGGLRHPRQRTRWGPQWPTRALPAACTCTLTAGAAPWP